MSLSASLPFALYWFNNEGGNGQNGVERLRCGDGQMNGERKRVWKQQKVEGESGEEQQ